MNGKRGVGSKRAALAEQEDAQEPLTQQIWALHEAAAELSALADLFRLRRRDDSPPLDVERVNWGMSKLLESLAQKVYQALEPIEEARFKDLKALKGSSTRRSQ